MRITEAQYLAFAISARKSLKASVKLFKQDEGIYNCVISIHNLLADYFAFLYIHDEIYSGEKIVLYNKKGERIEQMREFHGEQVIVHSRTAGYIVSPKPPQFKDWELVWIPAFGIQNFELLLSQTADRLYIGNQIFFLGKEREASLRFCYYSFASEMASVPFESVKISAT